MNFRALALRARNLLAAQADRAGQVTITVGPFSAIWYPPKAIAEQTPRAAACPPEGPCLKPGRCLACAARVR